jgi:hypothetical protein
MSLFGPILMIAACESIIDLFREMRVNLRLALTAAWAAILALPAAAATVTYTGGDVFVDRGSGYTAIRNSTSVKPGDVVMAKVGGTAEVVYEDGCRQAVDVGSVVAVGQTSPCAANAPAGDTTFYVLAGLGVAAGVGLAIALSGDDDQTASAE